MSHIVWKNRGFQWLVLTMLAFVWGIFDGETVTLLQLVWISLILLGVYLVNRNNRT